MEARILSLYIINWDLNYKTVLICSLWASYLDLLDLEESRKEEIAILSNVRLTNNFGLKDAA